MTTLSSTPAVLARNALVAAVGRFGPRLVLRAFDGIADWRPPTTPYAAGAPDPETASN
ncbi:hypothetical protein [Streptomyces gobiensis]|uniref:hypothetical protein n=1 Tax=Streptomyces gobiensis TaxID=2875706 RepID=UPI003BB08B8A